MKDWIRNLVTSPPEIVRQPAMDEDLMLELRQSLKEIETLYSAGAMLCGRLCPNRLPNGLEFFRDTMADLHRGLLIKIFVEIAFCDRRWHRAEREAGLVLLKHVWGDRVDEQNLDRALENSINLAKSLRWKALLEVFVQMPPLAEQIPQLDCLAIRIANIIAKADGRIVPSEGEALNRIVDSMESVFALRMRHSPSARSETAVADPWMQVATEPGKSVRPAGETSLARKKMGPKKSSETTGKKMKSDGNQSRASNQKRNPGAGGQSESEHTAIGEAMAELDQMIGLANVKSEVRGLINFLRVQQQRERHQLPGTPITLHTVFVGNPGTGKTTVARILSRALGAMGIVQQGHIVETDRSGMVAGYAGQTSIKANACIDEAIGGILFIDEAYSLVAEQGDDPFGEEATQVLLKRMEDERDQLVVVLAGYPARMQQLLKSNPGLSSRFQRTILFPDYSAEELLHIFHQLCRQHHYVVTPDADKKLSKGFHAMCSTRDDQFGNARTVRNLFERTIRSLANRVILITPITRQLLITIESDDIQL